MHGESGALTGLLGLDEGGDLGAEAGPSGLGDVGRGPGRSGKEATDAGAGGLAGNMAREG